MLGATDRETQRWTLVPDEYSPAAAHEFVGHARDALRMGESAELAVVDADDHGHVLGAAGLVSIAWELERAEIGYWTSPQARGQGVAVRAVRLLADWSFDHLPLRRLQLMPYLDNRPSQLVAGRAGFEREGVLRAYFKAKTGFVDVVMFARVRE